MTGGHRIQKQIIGILREQEAGARTAEVCRRHGISSAAFYKWKGKYGGLDVSDARRLKALEDENAKLKKLLAEAMLDNAMLKEISSRRLVPDLIADGDARRGARGRRSPQVAVRGERTAGVFGARHRPELGPLPERQAGRCGGAGPAARTGGDPPSLRLSPPPPPAWAEGIAINHKKLRRLYREERLQVRRRRGRKRALGTRAPIALPEGPNQRWSLDFVSDTLTDGRCFRILAVVDDFSRECLCLIADTSLSGRRVARELDAVITRRGTRPSSWSATTAPS